MEWIHVSVTVLGALSGWLLFRKLRFIRATGTVPPLEISVVIPARNEARNLPGLLKDLQKQTLRPFEVIVVDDASEDDTAAVSLQAGASLVQVKQKPAGWAGKSYACQLGAEKAQGNLLLFLDADVRLAPGALASLGTEYMAGRCVVSVQPWHSVPGWYEQLALFFNLIAVAAMGDAVPGKRSPGLFGPVILMPAAVYRLVGGHAAVKGSVVEDLSLGEKLEARSLPYRRMLGGGVIQFRMYPGGILDLLQGFIKNFAAGAMKTSPLLLLLVVLWVTALIRAPVGIILYAGSPGFWLFAYILLYFLLTGYLFVAARKVGSFKPLAVLLYPVGLLAFVLVFVVSLYKRLLHRPVVWKGRKMETGKEG